MSFCTVADAEKEEAVTATAAEGGGGNNDEKIIKEAAEMLDIRVGRIVKAWRHEEADSLYVEEVDVGESEPRIICSGLVNYIPLHLLQVYLISLPHSLIINLGIPISDFN